MVTHFRERLKHKSKKELEHIVSAHEVYQFAAVKAAVELLEEQHGISLPLPYEEKKAVKNEGDVFTYQYYFRTFSHREITSAITLAFLFYAIVLIFGYLSSVPWIDEHTVALLILPLLLICTLNHIFYKREHKRRNLFVGRLIQTGLLFIFIMVMIFLGAWMMGRSEAFSLENPVPVLLGFFFVLLVTEGTISMVRRILTLFEWHIW